ncbi:hypothetical protein ID866_12564, partial [Astraeus odoratus]
MVKLLHLWDELGIPHEEHKQVYDLTLPIIGFEVDPNLMQVQMTDDSCEHLITFVSDFTHRGTCCSLHNFQRLAGYLNWALNIYPLLCPGLLAVYAKTAGKIHQNAPLWVNHDVVQELSLLVHHLCSSNGVYVLSTLSWD